MGTRGGRDDEERHPGHEDDHPDYARGQEREEIHTNHPDFARGERQDETDWREGDFAQGQEDPDGHLQTHDHGDFARGQRREDPDRS